MDANPIRTIVISAVVAAFIGGTMVMTLGQIQLSELLAEGGLSDEGSCNVLGIYVHGPIATTQLQLDAMSPDPEGGAQQARGVVSRDIEYYLENAAEDSTIKAVLIDIDSPGGGVVAGEEIARAIAGFEKPSVSVIREYGMSAAYLIAASAGAVFASEASGIGSIGITQSYADYSEKNEKEGIVYHELTTGKFKESGSPMKPLTEEERAIFMRDLEILHDQFVRSIATLRNLPVETVEALADGSSMLGLAALEKGLIDAIGGRYDAEAYLTELIGEPAVTCWANDPAYADTQIEG